MRLIFGFAFEQPVGTTRKITVLTFGYLFDQPIILSRNITHLTLENKFNQPIVLTKKLSHLTLGYCFKHRIELTNVTMIKVDCSNHAVIDGLTNSTKQIVLKYFFVFTHE